MRIKEIKYNISKLKSSISNEVFTFLFVLLFNGKTECLRKINFFEEQNGEINKKLQILKKSLCGLEHYFNGKTSNWVSEFLDFYIYKKEEKYKDKIISLLKNDFKRDFNELSDIIESISLKLVV
jgi:hypothetical protein